MRFRVADCFHVILSLSVILLLVVVRFKLPNKTHVINTKPPEPKRQSVTLDDGVFTYHLNLSHFQDEFPHLQSYNCSLIYTPRPDNGGASPLLLLAIKSHPASVSRRAALRKTWAKPVEVMGYRVRPVFLMGLSDHNKHMELVKVEETEYGDILLWNFTEGHHNLSLKERCLLEWLHYNPSQATFIFKGDDDVFVNPAALVQYIKVNASSPSTLHGALQRHSIVLRYSKYQVSRTLFSNTKYPYFLSGGGFLFPGAAVPPLYHASLRLPVFPLDDVYFGILSLAANLTLRHENRFYVFGLKFDPCNYRRAFVVHRVEPDYLLRIWGQVHEAKCNSTEPNNK
ncbi:acetylgalactosaminyl-O-glycosyl-glycoprotein beta-1,3-N-acetylglucosaminyltransferase-like isoform X2 [Hyla sarda]|nr:acetylgalactosaminyl-O-glycosyl-glycoprotein beta-1,3-N-acetylglucosaminyltransferase-like isoform X2 [Hyla sarda]XP_056410516.1 acetylgalactosaminyl-O-glycosyl-glycoprotein beta-1,3-N-acetylglucosaminyltransferase-like isoform X2 [Hyla sarda]XP_056410517.1 acetylgalactosaminyl-O-glycosyl-glycoprotein beta-1,3-N-acetylglucosaminyltransferase-like isoform X2 [Hyla sarda]XP_056410518.1 acetylgalactosaminyl-O-glycosyl-glycoprotein beta-1,3-N-acetylglucosaminyltransferase-like isoform X2 [Hyla sa